MSRWKHNENWEHYVSACHDERTRKITPAVINYRGVVLVETEKEAYELYRHFNAISKHMDRTVVNYTKIFDNDFQCFLFRIEIKNTKTLDIQSISVYIRDAMGERKEAK